MNKKELIEELLADLCVLHKDGLPHLRSEKSISYISEFFNERGMWETGQMIIENLFEDDKQFKNSDLNKVIKYKTVNDEDAEGKVGNLLRRPKEEDAYIQAVAALGGKDSDRYKKAMDDLGAEGQPNRDIEKEREKGEKASGGVGGEEPQTGTAFDPETKGGAAYLKNLPDEDPAKPDSMKNNDDVSDKQRRIIAGKDKTLKKIDTLETPEFNKDLIPNDDEFAERNKNISNPIPPQPYKIPQSLIGDVKFPKKYITALERMMNTKPTGDGTKWNHYSDIPGGAGQISAQAGELMTMMGVTMDETKFEEFTNSLLQHEADLIKNNPKLKSESTRIITKSWINSSKNNRTAILNRIAKEYPNSEIIVAGWDTKDDVESLGLDNYGANKGFSTDMYLKIKTEDGVDILDEISLKKSTEVNFLNSGAGKFSEWDDNLPDIINQNVYRDNQRNRLTEYGEKFKQDIDTLLSSGSDTATELIKTFKAKKIDFTQALNATKIGKGSRANSKVILETIKALANNGNVDAIKYLDETNKIHNEFQKNAISAITENPKMKEGMLSEIRSEFPLKAISDGEETMAIGEYSLDRTVMKEIFGTSDYDDIKERLSAEPGPPPFLGYRAEIGDNVIPLAEIKVREDGVGYGGQIKFEMQLDRRFAKVLKRANEIVYSKK